MVESKVFAAQWEKAGGGNWKGKEKGNRRKEGKKE